MLVGPNGQKVRADERRRWPHGPRQRDVTIDDEATEGFPTGSQITGTHYKPTDDTDVADSFPAPAPPVGGAGSQMSAFDGFNPNGTWQLFVLDDAAGDRRLHLRLDPGPDDDRRDTALPLDGAGLRGPAPSLTSTSPCTVLHHSFSDDLDMMLVGPDGQRALIMSDAGGDADVTSLELVIDDESDRAMPDQNAFTTGSYRPGNFDAGDDPFPGPAPSSAGIGTSLSVFDGTDPNGAWQLFVVDDASVDDGHLEGGWTLHITTTDPAPTTTPAPGTGTGTPAPDRHGTRHRHHPPAGRQPQPEDRRHQCQARRHRQGSAVREGPNGNRHRLHRPTHPQGQHQGRRRRGPLRPDDAHRQHRPGCAAQGRHDLPRRADDRHHRPGRQRPGPEAGQDRHAEGGVDVHDPVTTG